MCLSKRDALDAGRQEPAGRLGRRRGGLERRARLARCHDWNLTPSRRSSRGSANIAVPLSFLEDYRLEDFEEHFNGLIEADREYDAIMLRCGEEPTGRGKKPMTDS